MKESILLLGSNGQVGTELALKLREIYGEGNVLPTDIREANEELKHSGPYKMLDAMDASAIAETVRERKVTQIYHLAALLSASAEKNPDLGWRLNMESLLSVLNIAKDNGVRRVFWPSSIAAFGPTTPKVDTPQVTVMEPTTVYGISKLAGERWAEYYWKKHGVDTRSIRYPGLISYKTEPGGGTTDYAIHIFHDALAGRNYTCFLEKDTRLPMLYMPDAVEGTLKLMEAPADSLSIRSSYNLTGFSFSPEELAGIVQQHIPQFSISYEPDFRQQIANTWPNSIDDSQARKDWGWEPQYSLEEMVSDMLEQIAAGQPVKNE